MTHKKTLSWKIALPFSLLASLIVAGILSLQQQTSSVHILLLCTLGFGSIPLAYQIVISFARRRFGIDIIAITAILGSGFLGEYFVGIVILLMLSTGEMLEYFAFQRARREITALMNNAPTIAHKKVDGTLMDITIKKVCINDILIVRVGETIPVDGVIVEGETTVDEAVLTGESIPLEKRKYMTVMSGSINQSGSIEIRATATSKDSQYEHIIRLVKEAQSNEAPFVRMADAYSAKFTLITFAFALAAWFISGDFLRVLAVLVVATPCPLILATPIAFASGISRAAKRGIIIKNGGALEHLGKARAFVFDKTGTLTLGMPQVQFIDEHDMSQSDIIRIAASLEQFSAHIIAHSINQYAKERKIQTSLPEHFEEVIGKGVTGIVDNKRYFFGNLSYLESHGIELSHDMLLKHETSKDLGIIITYLATEKEIVGDIHFSDIIRPEIPYLFKSLTALGVEKIVMLTGDKEKVAAHIAKQAGITEYRSSCLPEDKISEIQKLKKTFSPVIMIGDGINDAPALVEADMGIALGARGSTAASEAGDIVITVNTLERVVEAFQIGKKVLTVAQQGIFIGIGCSIILMIFATLGFIPPVLGAILQEIIDAITILNALRVHTSIKVLDMPH